MAEFKISVGIQGLEAAREAVYRGVLPRLTQAVGAVAQQARVDWMKAVKSAKLWDGEKTPYMASIQWKMTGPFSALVWSDYKHAEEIETGRPAKDLKKMLDTSLRVRVSSKGRRYLIIPFRHNVEQMPEAVYEQAKQLTPSSIIGTGRRLSGTGAMDIKTRASATVPQQIYQWGQRLMGGSMGPNPLGKSDRFAGMYRFDTSSQKSKRSSYLTFRVMAEGQPGWIVPAKPGLYLAKSVADNLQSKASIVFGEAVKRDLG